MNRSYSKIRHIQEANQNLEKRLLSEQSDAAFDRRYGTAAAAAKTNADNRAMINSVADWYKSNNHTINTVLGIGATFIPFVGPFIASGIGMMDAKQHYDEGHRTEAGIVFAFSLIPGIGMLKNLTPGFKQLGSKGMVQLAKKIGTKAPLSKIEQEVLEVISKNSELIKKAVETSGKQMAATGASKVTNAAVKSQLSKLAHKGVHTAVERGVEHGTMHSLSH
jgi:hypothetical protein